MGNKGGREGGKREGQSEEKGGMAGGRLKPLKEMMDDGGEGETKENER